jgi:predicted CxxxxCH...CXXCH cytochrome family protein
VKHNETYGFACSTCHNGYGSGGASEPTHPSGTINIAFDPSGMATRNGQDGNTPVWSTPTCNDIYCHSDGRSAVRGSEGPIQWAKTPGPGTATYTDPVWTGSITTCSGCHNGGNGTTTGLTGVYTVSTPGWIDPNPPGSGKHTSAAHLGNSQENGTGTGGVHNGYTDVQCFWCHNANNGDDGDGMFIGTYGTSLHVDGTTHFDPRSYVDGGTMLNKHDGTSFSYSMLGSATHCGDGKKCW